METVHQADQEIIDVTSLETDARWLLVKRIAYSATFNRSDRLSKLLLYVSKMHITGRDEEINEQRIGIEIFRRPPSFDSGADSIVRSHATRLRHRLESYFATEGTSELLRIEIPRGGYVPRFYSVEPDDTHVDVPVSSFATQIPLVDEAGRMPIETTERLVTPPIQDATERNHGSWAKPFAAGMLLAILMIAATVFFFRQWTSFASPAAGSGQSPIERRFWDGLFAGRNRTVVVTGDSGLVLYETLAKREISLSDYLTGAYRSGGAEATADAQSLERDFATRRYTSLADLSLAVELSHLPQWKNDHAQVVFARDLRPADAASANLILIGSREANPWVSLVDTSMNFVLTSDAAGHFYFVNRHPAPNEKASYIPSEPGSAMGDSSVYALICYRPKSQGMGKVLLVSGLWMSGTEAAGNFILDHQQFSEFLTSIERPDGSIPPFELLVQIHSLAGDAVSSSIIARRIG